MTTKPKKEMTPAQETSVNIVRLVLDFIVRIIEICKLKKQNTASTENTHPTPPSEAEEE